MLNFRESCHDRPDPRDAAIQKPVIQLQQISRIYGHIDQEMVPAR
jgi:hypothetical protein